MREINRRLRGHQFMPTLAIQRKIPNLYETDGVPAADKIVYAHYFCAGADWYIVEMSPDTSEAFGYTRLAAMPDCAEWGYTDMCALETLRPRPFGVVERDMHWTPCKFSDVRGL